MLVTFNSRIKKDSDTNNEPEPIVSDTIEAPLPSQVPQSQIPTSQDIKLINSNDDFLFYKQSNKRSKNGCLTCKIRKKKCNEVRPVCSDCQRLSKKCFWVEPNMNAQEIKSLKQRVQKDEAVQKMRKRKAKPKTTDGDDSFSEKTQLHLTQEVSVGLKKRHLDSDKSHVASPVGKDIASSSASASVYANSIKDFDSNLGLESSQSSSGNFPANFPVYNSTTPLKSGSNVSSGMSNGAIPQKPEFKLGLPQVDSRPLNVAASNSVNVPNHLLAANVDITKSRSLNANDYFPNKNTLSYLKNDIPSASLDYSIKYPLKDIPSTSNLLAASSSHLLNGSSTNLANSLANPFSFSSLAQHYETNINENGIQITRVYEGSPKSQVPDSPDLLSFFKYHKPPVPNSPTISNLMNPIDENENYSELTKADQKRFNDNKDKAFIENEDENNEEQSKSLEEYERPAMSPSVFLNFLKDLKHYEPKLTLLDDDSNPQESVSHENEDQQKGLALLSQRISENAGSMSPDMYGNMMNEIYSMMTPLPSTEPSYLPDLSSTTASYLYNYYEQTLSRHVSIAPTSQNESNSYQKVFLPLAHKDQGVLYAILGWAGFHLGGDWVKEGMKYTQLSLNHLLKSMFGIEDFNNLPLRFNATKSSFLPTGNEDRDSIVVKLSTLLILCGSEICRGDVKNWSIDLSWCWKILAENGGILKYNTSKEGHWLLSNFAYHDLLSSSSNERGTYFPSEQYDIIFRDQEGYSRGNLNPLLGVSKKLYRIIGDISTLVYDSKKQLDRYYNRDKGPFHLNSLASSPQLNEALDDIYDDDSSELSEHGKISRLLLSVIDKSKKLEQEIDTSRPDAQDLVGLTEEELELQLTIFEAFQISAKLFLRQSIMKCNPSMLECQVLNNDLIKCIDMLVGSPVQASLVFPAFMAGVHSVTPHDRDLMRLRMDNFIKLYGPWNLSRAKFLMEKVWQNNLNGDNVVDWYSILKELGWDINFA